MTTEEPQAPDCDVHVESDQLVVGPTTVSFMRTLRVPEKGSHPLPPMLGRFPVRRVDDYPNTVPPEWLAHGGVMIPIYQREAMWLSFESAEPVALQVGVGKVNAVSGKKWTQQLKARPQNYLALPRQPWLDGINSGKRKVRQFVAVPIGSGATVEAQVTGEETHGGIQLNAVGLMPDALIAWQRRPVPQFDSGMLFGAPMAATPAMGLGAGGSIKQKRYPDSRPLTDYDPTRHWRAFVHFCSATEWTAITGEPAPSTPINRDAYVAFGLPWFELFDADAADVNAADSLAKVKSVSEILGIVEPPSVPVDPASIVHLNTTSAVSDGDW